MDGYDKKWAYRKKSNQAEGIFESYLDLKEIEYVKCGIDAIERNLPGLRYVSDFVRCQPDYLVFKEIKKPIFVEVKGFANFIKLKPKDLRSYIQWKDQHPVWLFMYNLKNDTRCIASIDKVCNVIRMRKPEIKHYPESQKNTYYEMPPSWFDFEPI